ncbi:hypothetical protein [Flavobacterium crassostreae]|uniref:Uncharacterized protein n=1 Tax=Flavobacterium crassostreae TaxID=1763534 RepID=A0A1B9DYQ2_9FLAO|nr:hypothetical protein [Flavobacterium crassostreae]OCB74822.1 hypothetical protein LPBF_09415 [Flavobacterium crassostreae]
MQKNFKPAPNAFKHTFCVFQEVPISATEGLKVQYQSKAGSTYYYTPLGMYRWSNHWGRLANSKWRLVALEQQPTTTKFKLGFAAWDGFYPDNNTDLLYYLEVDYTRKTVNYQHKNNPLYDKRAVLRNSLDTTKKIKQIRNLFALTSWAKYYEFEDLDLLRKRIIDQLVYTNASLEEIKKSI